MNSFLHLLRKALRLPPPRISREQAIEIALAHLAKCGESFIQCDNDHGPTVSEGLKTWIVSLDPDVIPCRVAVVDNQTGEVVKFVSPPM